MKSVSKLLDEYKGGYKGCQGLYKGLTMNYRRGKVPRHWGVFVVKRCDWTLLLLVASAVIFVSVVPKVDDPETAFNEIDTPINQTIPVAPWVKFAPPTRVPIILPRSFGPNKRRDSHAVESISLPTHWHSSPLRELLCTLLI
jgi:hypothetical protein